MAGDEDAPPGERDAGPPFEDVGVARPRGGVPPEGRGPRLVLDGVVETGVEAGAVVLRTTGGTWLMGGAHAGLVGHRVRVTGAELRGMLTTAQQGPPLVVDDVEDLGPA